QISAARPSLLLVLLAIVSGVPTDDRRCSIAGTKYAPLFHPKPTCCWRGEWRGTNCQQLHRFSNWRAGLPGEYPPVFYRLAIFGRPSLPGANDFRLVYLFGRCRWPGTVLAQCAVNE